MNRIFVASQNNHKIKEIEALLEGVVQLESIYSIGQLDELEETGTNLEENALQKARFVFNKFKVNCFADDTGLEVESLHNAPGVYSARYAGDQRDPQANMNLLLKNLEDKPNRNAQFRTVIALILDGKEFLFEGAVRGKIIQEKKGDHGFGYDPIFKPDGYDKTFSEMDDALKNKISHRAIAVNKLAEFLKKI
jgi:XTP/dITP diphosphohydrolase